MICRNCNKNLKKPILNFKKYPVSLWPCSKILSKKLASLKIYCCSKCSLSQLQRFTKKSMNLFYKNESKVLPNKNLIKSRVSKIKKHIGQLTNLKVLEIGGGRNDVVSYFNFKEKYVCDFDIEKKIKKTIIINSNFEKIKGFEHYFDYIFFFHTLEHIENPNTFLSNIYKKLKPNGKIILEVPNYKYYLSKIPYYAFFFQHQMLFTNKSLKNLMASNNFIIEKNLSSKNKDIIISVFNKGDSKYSEFPKEKSILKKITYKINKKILNLKKFIKKNKIKNIAVYGSGGVSMTLHYHLKQKNIKVNSFYDNDFRKFNLYVPGTNNRIKKGSTFNEKYYDLILTTNEDLKNYLRRKLKKPIISLE